MRAIASTLRTPSGSVRAATALDLLCKIVQACIRAPLVIFSTIFPNFGLKHRDQRAVGLLNGKYARPAKAPPLTASTSPVT